MPADERAVRRRLRLRRLLVAAAESEVFGARRAGTMSGRVGRQERRHWLQRGMRLPSSARSQRSAARRNLGIGRRAKGRFTTVPSTPRRAISTRILTEAPRGQGRLHECKTRINKRARDFPGDGIEEDCSGKADHEATECDLAFSIDGCDPFDAAKSIGRERISAMLARGPTWSLPDAMF